MTHVIVIGHGGYGSAIKRNLGMLLGEAKNYHYIDFNETDSTEILQEKMNAVLAEVGEEDVLFCCDLIAGTPFREAAMVCVNHPTYSCVAGLNTSAYAEMTFHLDETPAALGAMGCEVAKEGIVQFPENM